MQESCGRMRIVVNSRCGIGLSRFRMERESRARDGHGSKSPSRCKVRTYDDGKTAKIGAVRASCSRRAHSDDDLHKSASEGEGACSRVCADCSHLPLRGKLGWMTPRPGQKKTGKRNAPSGALDPKQGPQYFSRGRKRRPRAASAELFFPHWKMASWDPPLRHSIPN